MTGLASSGRRRISPQGVAWVPSVADSLRYIGRRSLLGLADYAVTMPVVRWTWTGPVEDDLIPALGEFRPSDRETVLEMMAGRYLLASKLITSTISQFNAPTLEQVGVGDRQDLGVAGCRRRGATPGIAGGSG